jgi:hypothetical protein
MNQATIQKRTVLWETFRRKESEGILHSVAASSVTSDKALAEPKW